MLSGMGYDAPHKGDIKAPGEGLAQPLPDVTPRAWPAIRERLAELYPDWITVSEVARILGVTIRSVVRTHQPRLRHVLITELDGRPLTTPTYIYLASEVKTYNRTRKRALQGTTMTLRGIKIERLQKICERYYRQNLDIGAPELLALAKEIAKL
jgi:hypothetical protein